MTAVVIDASAGVEIVADTRRGRALARLVPAEAEGWVPEHFYAEVLGVLRRQLLIEKVITEPQATAALARLLTDDYKLVDGPTFPRRVTILRLPRSTPT